MSALHKARPLPPEQRLTALTTAGELFATGTINGLSPTDYQHMVSRLGTPVATVGGAVDVIRRSDTSAYLSAQHARPVGAVNDWRGGLTRTGRAVWIRRGNSFAVHAAGNHPAVHSLWLEALALGRLRGRRRDPAPGRSEHGLRQPRGDRQIRHRSHRAAQRTGPLEDPDHRRDRLAGLPGHDRRLDQPPGRRGLCQHHRRVPPDDEKAVLPGYSLQAAKTFEEYLLTTAQGTISHLGGHGVVDELGEGSAVLRPAVHQVDSPSATQVNVELGFPCVWVAPWTREAGTSVFTNTLVLTAVTQDEQLLDDLLADPTIKNLYIGNHPTYWMAPGIPHDAYLGEFLMRSKAVIRG